MLVWNCSGGEDPITPTYNNTIKTFDILSSVNNMSSDALVVKIDDFIYVTVDEGVSLHPLFLPSNQEKVPLSISMINLWILV